MTLDQATAILAVHSLNKSVDSYRQVPTIHQGSEGITFVPAGEAAFMLNKADSLTGRETQTRKISHVYRIVITDDELKDMDQAQFLLLLEACEDKVRTFGNGILTIRRPGREQEFFRKLTQEDGALQTGNELRICVYEEEYTKGL